jgi:hypothetical protein
MGAWLKTGSWKNQQIDKLLTRFTMKSREPSQITEVTMGNDDVSTDLMEK